MFKYLICACYLILSISAQGQNLVPNGSFEEYETCPNSFAQLEYATGWLNFYKTPDFCHTCSTDINSSVPLNSHGTQTPATGDGYVYITALCPGGGCIDTNGRENLGIQLTEPLIIDQWYLVKFKASRADNTNFASELQVKFTTQEHSLENQVDIESGPHLSTEEVVGSTTSWFQYEEIYQADSVYNYFSLGNFNHVSETNYEEFNGTGFTGAGYYIDDIEVYEYIGTPTYSISNDTICDGESVEAIFNGNPITGWAEAENPEVLIGTEAVITLTPEVTTDYLLYHPFDTLEFTIVVESVVDEAEFVDGWAACEFDESLEIGFEEYPPSTTFDWSTGSTNDSITLTYGGDYWVETHYLNCTKLIEFEVLYFPNEDYLGNDTILCEGDEITLEVMQLTEQWHTWQDFSNEPFLTVNEEGIYSVRVFYNGDYEGCHQMSEDTIFVDMIELPDIDFGMDTTLCDGTNLELIAFWPNSTYLWQDESTDPIFLVGSPGNYSVLIDTLGCTTTEEITVEYQVLPTIDLGPDLTMCPGDLLSVEYSSEIYDFNWSNGSTDPSIQITEEGYYWLELDSLYCSSTDSIYITTLPLPVFSLGDNLELCEGDTEILAAPEFGSIVQWSDGSTLPAFEASVEGIVWLEIEENSCRYTDSLSVTVHPFPTTSLNNSYQLCQDQTSFLTTTYLENANYLWSTGSINDTLIIDQPGSYWVSVELNDCVTTDYTTVEEIFCSGEIVMPNIFTPNDDGINDLFRPIEEFKFEKVTTRIFNRWGNLIHESDQLDILWDGTNLDGIEVGDGTFYYVIDAEDFTLGQHRFSGYFMLVR